jgi:hypothetical protein
MTIWGFKDELAAERAAEFFAEPRQLTERPPQRRRATFGTSLVCKTPTGGILARSGTTPGNALCKIVNLSGSTLSDSTAEIDVLNLSTSAVGANRYIVAVMTNIGWQAVWEDC